MTSSPFSILAVLLFFLFQLGVFAETKKLSIFIQQKLKETETPKPISWIGSGWIGSVFFEFTIINKSSLQNS